MNSENVAYQKGIEFVRVGCVGTNPYTEDHPISVQEAWDRGVIVEMVAIFGAKIDLKFYRDLIR
jgi:hypothetical protein